MRNTERKKIEVKKNGKKVWGHITLNDLAIPETMRITINGEKIKPSSFDIYGSPNFSKEIALYYDWKEKEIQRKNGKENYILKAEISYEPRIFDIPRETFDSKEGITKSLNSIQSFCEMLKNRLIFYTKYNENLNEFVIYGNYLLNNTGQILFNESPISPTIVIPNVMDKQQFGHMLNSYEMSTPNYTTTSKIPHAGDTCPCCGRKFTMEDIKTASFSFFNKKLAHKECAYKFQIQKEKNLFCSLIDKVYSKPKFDLYEAKYLTIYIFHTVDGDIQMHTGTEKNSIFISYSNVKNYNHCSTTSEATAYAYLKRTHAILKNNPSKLG